MRCRHALFGFVAILVVGASVSASAQSVVQGCSELDLGLHSPVSICVTSSELAVLEPSANQMTVFTPSGVKMASVEIQGRPLGLVQASDGAFYVGQRETNSVLRVDPQLGSMTQFTDALRGIVGIVSLGNEIAVLESDVSEISIFGANGQKLRSVALAHQGGPLFGLAHDVVSGTWWTIDTRDARLHAFDAQGAAVASFVGDSNTPMSRPAALTCDARGRVYVADRYQGAIAIFSLEQGLVAAVTSADLCVGDLSLPMDLATDPAGGLFVVSDASAKVLVLDLDLEAVGRPGPLAVTVSPKAGQVVSPDDAEFRVDVRAPASGAADLRIAIEVFDVAAQAMAIASGEIDVTQTSIVGDEVVADFRWNAAGALGLDRDYRWRAKVDQGTAVGTWSDWVNFRVGDVPARFFIEGNYPNPFNPMTEIIYQIPSTERVTIVITGVRGQRVTELDAGVLTAGRHRTTWNGTDARGQQVASGVYFYSVQAGSESRVGKMLLVR